MFGRKLFGRFTIRSIVGIVGAILAGVGGARGLLTIASSVGNSPTVASLTTWSFLARVFLGLAALWGAFSIYRAGTALLFPRGRLAVAGFLTAVIGFFLLILGFGVDAILVLAGGVAAFIGAEL